MLADQLSRKEVDPYKWDAKQELFQDVVHWWVVPEVDIFLLPQRTTEQILYQHADSGLPGHKCSLLNWAGMLYMPSL